MTALAFEHFSKSRVDIGIIEVGLGGRLDATNVLTHPELTICTDISYDHVEILGNTLRKIAFEKAGIIKPGVPHLIGFLPKEATQVMVRTCRKRKAPLTKLSRKQFTFDEKRMRLDYLAADFMQKNLEPSLIGAHQLKNAALVLKAVSMLRQDSIKVTKAAVKRGLASTHWPGRFQVIAKPKRPTLVLDVGHNAAGVRAFADSFTKRFPGKRAVCIVGFVKRKEHELMFSALSEIASEFRLVKMKTHRSMDLDELIASVPRQNIPVKKYSSLNAALDQLVNRGTEADIVVVMGSHYLVGEYLARYGS